MLKLLRELAGPDANSCPGYEPFVAISQLSPPPPSRHSLSVSPLSAVSADTHESGHHSGGGTDSFDGPSFEKRTSLISRLQSIQRRKLSVRRSTVFDVEEEQTTTQSSRQFYGVGRTVDCSPNAGGTALTATTLSGSSSASNQAIEPSAGDNNNVFDDSPPIHNVYDPLLGLFDAPNPSSSSVLDVGEANGQTGLQSSPLRLPRTIILHYSAGKAAWDWLVLILVMYIAIYTPYVAAFLSVKQSDPLVVVDLAVDFMFMADMIINFRTTYMQNGEVIVDPKRIAVNYLRGWFLIDAVSAVPFDFVLSQTGASETVVATGLLKTPRLLRLLRVARRIDRYSEYGASVLLLLMATFTLFAHWLACAFYALAFYELPDLDPTIGYLNYLANLTGDTYVINGTVASGPDIRSCYITSLYFTFTILTSVGFGNVAPVTNYEKVFTIFAMMVGSLMSAAIFGNVSSIMLRLYQGTEEYHEKCNSIREFVRFHRIPPSLASRLLDAHAEMWYRTNGVDMSTILKNFPDTLQGDICLHLNKRLLIDCDAFHAANPGCLRLLSTKLKTLSAPPGDILLHHGDIVRAIFFIVKGSVEIARDDGVVMAIIGKNDAFGEDPRQTYRRHLASRIASFKSAFCVRTLSYCDIHSFELEDLIEILHTYPDFAYDFLRKFSVAFNLQPEQVTEHVDVVKIFRNYAHERRSTSVSFSLGPLPRADVNGEVSPTIPDELWTTDRTRCSSEPRRKPLVETITSKTYTSVEDSNSQKLTETAQEEGTSSSATDNDALSGSSEDVDNIDGELTSMQSSTMMMTSSSCATTSTDDADNSTQLPDDDSPRSDAPSLQWDNTGMDIPMVETSCEGTRHGAQMHDQCVHFYLTTADVTDLHDAFMNKSETEMLTSPEVGDRSSPSSHRSSSASSTVIASIASPGGDGTSIRTITPPLPLIPLTLPELDRRLADISERMKNFEHQLVTTVDAILEALGGSSYMYAKTP